MIGLLKFLFEKMDFIAITETIQKRKNRKIAATLHLILIQLYEIIELYEILLHQLKNELDQLLEIKNPKIISLNPSYISSLLNRQSSNLQILETLITDMFDELRVIDNSFLATYKSIFPSKFSIIFEAQGLLLQSRFPLSESGSDYFPASKKGEYKTLWFTSESPAGDRMEISKGLYGWDGKEKNIIDININDGEEFFHHLHDYFKKEKPKIKLKELKRITENYKNALIKSFTLEDLLSDIQKIRKYYN